MPQPEIDWLMSLALSAKNWAESKEQSGVRSAQSSASCRRSGRSPALPYPPHECLECTTFFPTLPKGDISTLQIRGHLYFALTDNPQGLLLFSEIDTMKMFSENVTLWTNE